MREGGGRSRVGVVVGGHVHGLHRRDGPAAGRGDALLQLTHLVGQRGLVSHRRGHAAQQVDTSEPAWVNRKMLSMNSSTSWFCSSRKYSAMVRPTEGDPHTSARRLVHLDRTPARCPWSTLASASSTQRSLPSRVRSPTPANTDAAEVAGDAVDHLLDEHRLADTGAAEQGDLAATDVGVSRSTTFRPVSSISVRASSRRMAGGLRWIDQWSKSVPWARLVEAVTEWR